MTSHVYLIETKSSGEDIEPGSTYWLRTLMDVQIGVYLRAAKQLGMDVLGICYDVLGKPLQRPYEATPIEARKYTKPTKKDPTSRLYANQRDRDETPEEFEKRCLEAIKSEPQAYYQRQIVVRFEKEHHESAADVWQSAQNMREARRLNVYPRHPDSCVQWSRPCEFLQVCAGMRSLDDPLFYYKEPREHEELEDVIEDDRARLTQSSLRVFRSCPRKYQNRYVLRARPVDRSEPLRMGTSLHRAVEALRRGWELNEAMSQLDQTDRYALAKERAMIIGYVARWGAPRGIVSVEQQFEIDLINPETGAASRTFRMAGKFDAIAACEEWELLDPGR